MAFALTSQEWFGVAMTSLLSVLILTPSVCSWLGLTRFQCEKTGCAAEIARDTKPEALELIDQLDAMRFVPLGLRVEKSQFLGPHWSWSGDDERVYRSPDSLSTAVIYYVAGRGPFVSFQSSCIDGDLISTTNNNVCDLSDVEGLTCQQVESPNARNVYTGHQWNLESYLGNDRVLEPIESLEQSNQNSLRSNLQVAKGDLFRDLDRTILQIYQSILLTTIVLSTFTTPIVSSPVEHYCIVISATLLSVSAFLILAFRFISPGSSETSSENLAHGDG